MVDRQEWLRLVTADITQTAPPKFARDGCKGGRTREGWVFDDFQPNLIPTLIFLPRAELEDTSS